MGREVSGSGVAKPASSAPLRTKGRRYGSVTAGTPLSRDLTFHHVAASEQGYSSLPGSRAAAEEPSAGSVGGGGTAGGFAQLLRRVVLGGVVITLFAAAVSTLFDGRDASESAVRGVIHPEMQAEEPAGGASSSHKGPSRTGLAHAGPRFLKIRASNEYGEFDKAALNLYKLDMLVEPHRETTLEVQDPDPALVTQSNKFVWRLQLVDDSGITSKSVEDVWNHTGGPEAKLTVTKAGTTYVLTVQNLGEDGTVLAEGRVKVSCKYVRREIRTLTDEDRELLLDTMEIWYTIPTSEGKVKYGSKFSNYERVVAYHDSRISDYCYHDGLQFLTSHAAFNLLTERYLQMINPKVSLPLWDFMIEAATMEDKWYNSIIFDKDWFGDAIGDPENDFMVSEGRFGNISTIYDPEKNIAKGGVKSNHNAYGYVTSTKNYQDLPRLTRTTSYCGLTSHATFATAETFVACFEENSSLYAWEDCMETKVHGDLHGLLGGGFNCNTDMKKFAEDHPEYDVDLLSFVLEYMTFNYWPMNGFISSANTCDTSCTKGQTEPCGCTCNIDAFAITDQETYDYCESFMSNAADKFTGDVYITYDEDAKYPYGFLKDGERISDEETLLLMRYMVKIGCEPGSVGAMSTGSSPLDPIFWTLHGLFEKALHILWLSPKYADRYDMQWEDGQCSGSAYTDKLPFTENILGLGPGKTFLTNKQILELMNPTGSGMPYLYENFNSWGEMELDLVGVHSSDE
eukprot:g9365.t1